MRARNLKPGFFKNEDLADIDPLGRLLFEGLWCMADREGRLEDRPKRIKAEILPYDNCDIDKLLWALTTKAFILRYSVNGGNYIQIYNFKKHQTPHMKEAESTVPAPDMNDTNLVQAQVEHSSSPSESFNLNPESFNLNPESLYKPCQKSDDFRPRGFSLESLAKLWNELSPDNLPRVHTPFKRPPAKLKKMTATLGRNPEKQFWVDLMKLLPSRPFLLGVNDRGWKATFDFVIEKAEEIMDGKYSGTKAQGQTAERAAGPIAWLAEREASREREG
jgi:hypothetical protein